MHIIHIASELAPLAKVGGLGDVLLGLARELSWKGHDVDIIIPKYDCMDSNQVRDMSINYPDLMSFYDGGWHHNSVWSGWVENLKVYFIDVHHPKYFFNRGCIYGCVDDSDRYLYFCRAALEFMLKKQMNPDIIHLHDWQTAAIAPLYYDMYNALGLKSAQVVSTIHNMEYQGRCSPAELEKIGLKASVYLTPEKLQDPIYPETVNLLKGMVVFSDFVTTVSPTYAKEVLTSPGGFGLESILQKHQHKFKGVLNGVDYSYWNPEIDRFLPAHYSAREMPQNKKDLNTLDKKAFIKKTLRDRLDLEEQHRPLVGCVTRLVPQKGPELIKHALFRTLEKGGQFVLLGSSPIESINLEFHKLRHEFNDHPHVHIILHHNEELAHLIYAGSDMFIVPSIFEPCGLTQLIALKYGSVPVVRAVGGLFDTVFDVDNSGKDFAETNGYTFLSPDDQGVNSALDRSIDCWFEKPERWRKLMVNGMNMDHSWNVACNQYIEIYKQLKNKGK